MEKPSLDQEAAVLVAGDVCLDVLQVPIRGQSEQSGPCENWKLSGGLHNQFSPGGAMLLSRLVACASDKPVAAPVFAVPFALAGEGAGAETLPDTMLGRLTSQDVIHSVLSLDLEVVGKGKDEVQQWRVAKTLGYAGPKDGHPLSMARLSGDRSDMPLVILDDAGNGFRRDEASWPMALRESGRGASLVIHKLHSPLPVFREEPGRYPSGNALWDAVQARYASTSIVIVDADDLRREGAAISRGLSWEKTALEIVWQLRGDMAFRYLRDCRHLVVRLGMDGALCYHNRGLDKMPDVQLVYDPEGVEGGFAEARRLGMVGVGDAFVAWLSGYLLEQDLGIWGQDQAAKQDEVIGAAVKLGLAAARRYYLAGFGAGGMPAHPDRTSLAGCERDGQKFAHIDVPVFSSADDPDPFHWSILDSRLPPGSKLEEVALAVLKQKKVPELSAIPVGIFRNLRTYDRAEIESYRSLCAIMREYLLNPAPKRPLSMAVFGPPGSGKSFGVQQVAEYVRGSVDLDVLPAFNLSQFHGVDELISALHIVRDSFVRKKVPLVFFDEFDASVDGEKFGWLKHFLAPMQDGVFMDRGTTHPIGKAIFIFAGGICSRYEEFMVSPDEKDAYARFKDAKGPDFVSRLRARLNIIGIDHASDLPRAASLIRRASILRFQFMDKAKAAFDAKGGLRIEDGLATALMRIPSYHHGVRSMEALLEMSRLVDCHKVGPDCLPSPAQLELHLHAETFRKLMLAPVSFGERDLEILGRAIHESFIAMRKKDGTFDPSERTHQAWDALDNADRCANHDQARNIPLQLQIVGRYIRRVSDGDPVVPSDLTESEVERLARLEHERWMSEKLRNGWRYGPYKRKDIKTHPCIVGWSDLQLKKEQEKDREAIRAIPTVLASAGYVII